MEKPATETTRDAKSFIKKWTGRGRERQDDKTFWEDLLEDVFGVTPVRDAIEVQKPVQFNGTTKYIDVYIKPAGVVIEQKSLGVDLDKAEEQSDGALLTPMQQGKRYYDWLDKPQQGRYIIACNFEEFRIFDTYHKSACEKVIKLSELARRWRELRFLVHTEEETRIEREVTEETVARTASEYVRKLYKSIVDKRKDLSSDELHSLNVFCVRVVFCLFAEDAGLFDNQQFHRFIEKFDVDELSWRFGHLFEILDDKCRPCCRFAPKELMAFPYVDGGLFKHDPRYKTPPISKETRDLLLSAWQIKYPKTGEPFYWSDISPTNFGCIFESTTEPEVRASGGMHYTTPANIHRVIDPLFLDDLKSELAAILQMPADQKDQKGRKRMALEDYRDRLSSLRFLDPACGSGNFLTETYRSLHELELEAIKAELNLNFQTYTSNVDPCKVQISQFFGIEIDDFAASVAKASLWIAECQMLQKTEEVLECRLEMLPLPKNANISCEDALTADWNEIFKRKVSAPTYIIGNPPFQGNKKMTASQRESMLTAMPDKVGGKRVWDKQGSLDFVCAWYAKAAAYMEDKKNVTAAFVSTNSIVQGEQVAPLWQPLMMYYHTRILFAWKTFSWFNKADEMAHVHCVIVGFYQSRRKRNKPHYIFEEGKEPVVADSINAYLMNAESYFIANRGVPLCNVPQMGIGNKPIDDGNYLFTEQQMKEFVAKEPASEKYFHPWYGAEEFINRTPRYCLWLGDCTPAEIDAMPQCKKRVQAVIKFREKSTSAATRELALTPRRFHVENMPGTTYMLIPCVSSENRDYVPMGFLEPTDFGSNATLIIPDVQKWHFGILESRIHMAWMRIVCGRLKSDYRYSAGIVYNNFPWPEMTEAQKAAIEETADSVLRARMLYPDSSLASLYEKASMPVELLRAHQRNDRAVADAFGIPLEWSDDQIALELMRRSVLMAKPASRQKGKARKKKTTAKKQ